MFHTDSQHSEKRFSTSSRRYRESTQLIPTPGTSIPRQRAVWPLHIWKVLFITSIMILLGVGIEVALAFSKQRNGFSVPQNNVFGFLQPSFLTAFFPTLLVAPLGYLWHVADRILRWYQPYITLSRGGVRAEDSLMVDYVMSSVMLSLFRTMKRREWILTASMVTALAVNFYQPLAGAVLSIQQISMPRDTAVLTTTTLGLSPDIHSLNSFLTAAGFAEAAAFQHLPDPPFIRGGWAVSQFSVFEDQGLNASITVPAYGVLMEADCSIPATIVLNTADINACTITATDVDGCAAVATFNASNTDQQYGTAATEPGTCGFPTSTDVDFVPVMFWFFHTAASGAQQARAVICRPKLQLFSVDEQVYLVNNSLTGVQIRSNYTTPNNITGSPLFGTPYNGVIFNSTGMNDFVKARAVAIQSQIPGAIFRLASQDPVLLQEFFDSPTAFLPLTQHIYTQHLAVSALSVYFVSERSIPGAVSTALVNRLVIDPLAAHALAIILILVGLAGIAIHLMHRHVRRTLYLNAVPGTIASVVALTSHSGFGELLFPYDDQRAIAGKLANLRFSLDRRTGAIIADELGGDGPYRPADGDRFELQRIHSGTPLVRNTVRQDSSELLPGSVFAEEMPYEHEPLVTERDPRTGF